MNFKKDKVILLKDVKKQGKKNDIIDVASGYANFLIKNNQAVSATESSVKRLNREKEEQKEALNNLIKDCEKIKVKLEKEELKFQVKTGAEDRVFGSVSAKQIAQELEKKGYNIDKKQIIIKTPLSSLGYHTLQIELHKQVIANIRVELVK